LRDTTAVSTHTGSARVALPSSRSETMMIALAEQIAEAHREFALRKTCYPQWVKSGKLDAGDAKYQIVVQEEIVRTLMRLDAEQRQLSLFGGQRVNLPCRAQAATTLFAMGHPHPGTTRSSAPQKGQRCRAAGGCIGESGPLDWGILAIGCGIGACRHLAHEG
jgi:hypothetical protein